MTVYNWSAIQKEELNPLFARQVIHGDSMTVARVFLSQGCVVPEHSHINEQLSVVEKGELQFVVGGREVTVKAGEALRIPSNVPHSVRATEEAISLDIFSGVREDWRDGTDAYLRR